MQFGRSSEGNIGHDSDHIDHRLRQKMSSLPSRRKRIALLLNFLDASYQVSFRAALERAANARGVDLITCIGRELNHQHVGDRAMNAIYEWITPESFDGVIMLSAALANFCGTDGIEQLAERLRPLPICSVGLPLTNAPFAIFDNQRSMQVAVDHLIQNHGARRIAYIGGPSHNEEARARREGYQAALLDRGIALDPLLVDIGHFTVATGRLAMQRILDRVPNVDAVAAANDSMAIGAMDELSARGLQIPENVVVVGFDDAPIARFAPRSLTTVAQPIDEMAEAAVEAVLTGATVANSRSQFAVQLMARESCGCSYVLGDRPEDTLVNETPLAEYLREHEGQLIEELLRRAGQARLLWEEFVPALLSALRLELEGEKGTFLRCLGNLVQEGDSEIRQTDELIRALAMTRSTLQQVGYFGEKFAQFDMLCLAGASALSTALSRIEGRTAMDAAERIYSLRHISQQLSAALDAQALAATFEAALDTLHFDTGLLCVFDPQDEEMLLPLVMRHEGKSHARGGSLGAEPYPRSQIIPTGFASEHQAGGLVLLPITFYSEVFGFVAFRGDADPLVCETLRGQMGASIKMARLHSQVVEETALRERLAQEKLLGELNTARNIQTTLIPAVPMVRGLDLAASMRPADRVGGDYYDFFEGEDAFWVAVGDVTGHGLEAGLIMLMLQSMTSAVLRTRVANTSSQVVTDVNRALQPNIRDRLKTNDHVTYAVLKIRPDGRVQYAGAHEDILVYRAASKKCESIATEGLWLGILPDVGPMTENFEFSLERGDVIVLYTDGITEARNARGEHFGLDRTIALIERHGAGDVEKLRASIEDRVLAWTPVQQDDLTLVVLRYDGETEVS